MSVLTDLIYGGSNAVAGLTEGAVNDAIAKYGADKEKAFLRANDFLDDGDKPTEKGEKAITRHSKVIDRHAAATSKPDCSTQILAQQKSLTRNGFTEYEFIANRDCCSLCGELNGKHFRVSDLVIGVNAPPMHEGCRCSIAGWSDRSEYDKWLNSL